MSDACFLPAHILLPDAAVPLEQWGCIACDQFTSDRAYWEGARKAAGEGPSALELILPEVYLEDPGLEERIGKIHTAMEQYAQSVLTRAVNGFIYVERTERSGRIRQGLVGMVDLEAYSYRRGALPAVRPSESTVESRIPPRMAVRRGALLEAPHVMMLADDPDKTLIESVAACKDRLPLVYEGELMMEGGHIAGWAVEDPALIAGIDEALRQLGSREAFDRKYPAAKGTKPLTLAVGDGNHSLATAKRCWEKIKSSLSEEERKTHPARFATVEVVELCDESLDFEPIHRVLFGAGEDAVGYIAARCGGDSNVKAVWKDREYSIPVSSNTSDAIADLQKAMDEYLIKNPSAGIDYVHGDDNAAKVAKDNDGVAIFMPTVEKDTLFDYVARRGVLPRKSFSMGNAEDKRYYYETKKIK